VAGEAAWLVNPESTEELANALVELTRNPDRRAALSRLGLQRAAQFSWDQAVEQTWQVYRELLNTMPD
jgi:glycosyltransferase involved in cell wall biosynthesis